MKYPQCTGKAAGRERKQIKVLKLSNLFFFFFVIILNLYIIYCQKFSVDSTRFFFYSEILVSLTCNYKNLICLQVKCMAWSITWEYTMYIIQLYHTYNGCFFQDSYITNFDVIIPSYRIFLITGSIPNVPSSMTAYSKSPL